MSVFWTWQLFTYLPWTPELDTAPYQQLVAAFNAVVAPTLTGTAVTGVGRAWGGAF